VTAAIHEDELGLRWAGGSIEQIRARWADDDPVGDICGETRIPAGRQHEALEALRHARSDVHYLLDLIDRAGIQSHDEDDWDGTWETARPVQDVPLAGDSL
jgi:hypothetical protein